MGDMGDRYIRMEDARRLEIISLSPLDFLVGGDLGEDGAGRLEIEVSQRGLKRT